ncbi:MAG: M56 family metallopeptidase, partial [Oscillospiraceae bacterium]|nr:M56 family metallopeptidase [Oscillospiraceae bacterium]
MNLTQMLMEWALTSAALILVVTALRTLLGKRVSAGLRYALWMVVLVRLLVPVQLFSLPVPAVLPEPGKGEVVEIVPPSAVSAPGGTENVGQPILAVPAPNTGTAAPATVPTSSVPKAEPLSVWQALGWLWLIGSILMAAAFLISNISFVRRLQRARAAVEGADCPLPVYTALNLPSPCLFGVLRPAVYITPETAVDPVMLCHVLAHEYTHFRHGDHVWNILRSAALAIHWWNPLVWLAVVVSRRDCELACDEGALKRLGDGERIAYGRTLLALLTEKPRSTHLLTCATTMTGGQKSVWERVTRIAHAPKRWLWAAVTAVLVTALACVCAFGQAAESEEPVPSDDPVA